MLGSPVGSLVGSPVGLLVGSSVGSFVGLLVGSVLGSVLGSVVGSVLGSVVGSVLAISACKHATHARMRMEIKKQARCLAILNFSLERTEGITYSEIESQK